MGWYGSAYTQTKKEFIEEILNGYEYSNSKVFVEQSSVRGNHLWVLLKEKLTDERYIILYMMQSRKGCWEYKPISEEAGPGYYDCPKKFLKLQTNIRNEFAKNWRDKIVNL